MAVLYVRDVPLSVRNVPKVYMMESVNMYHFHTITPEITRAVYYVCIWNVEQHSALCPYTALRRIVKPENDRER